MKYYLDEASTACVDSRVLKAMLPWFTKAYGNPSSSHELGLNSRNKIDHVRAQIARELGVKSHEIIFTSGVTESNNLVLQGLARASKQRKIVISAIEHASVDETCKYLETIGYEIVRIPVSPDGLLRLDILERTIDEKTLLVSIMHANNVIGTIQDIVAIGKMCKKRGVLFHTDASQSFCKLKINARDCHIDLLSASGHKIGGPKGAGFLYVRNGIKLLPLLFGGGQERGLRAGTENVPAIVGLGKALEVFKRSKQVAIVRNVLLTKLVNAGGIINGSLTRRLDSNLHISFPGHNSEMIVARLSHQGVYVSIGSACDSKKEKEDRVLQAIGLDKRAMDGSIRVTISDTIKSSDVNTIAKKIIAAVNAS